MGTPQEVLKLVERFDSNRDSYMAGEYKEAQIRIEFIDPFFEQLGWDMGNRNGYAEAYKDVIHEDSIKIGSATEAPDYCFRIGGTRKFFLEAKKPSVFIKEALHPAYQLRRYAWSSKLPLSILTDFEEFAIYDCRFKPNKNDSPALARIKYFTYRDYSEKWDEIYSVFSREAILKGSFDKYAESAKGKRGTTSVDASFLEEIENWRANLAKNIAMRNSQLSTRDLNFAVQKTIDRIIFLRICEDRGIEQYGKLGALQNGVNVYDRLVQHFRIADDKYNSGLFHFSDEKNRPEEPDNLTLNLKIDDKILKEIVGTLYYPECPFEFSVLPADILGQVYEQFLGKVIRLTDGHQAKVEEKPEVRKAGGVYYTPSYIVEYIVDNTVGKLLWEFTAKTQGICDACGEYLKKGSGFGGQGAETGDMGSGGREQRAAFKDKYENIDGEKCNEVLQGTDCLAGINESGGGSVSSNEEVSKRGNLCADQSGAKSGGVNTCKYCGRTRPHFDKGVLPSSFDSKGIPGGTGNSSSVGKPSRVSDRSPNGEINVNDGENWKTSQRPHECSKTKDHRFLTAPRSPNLRSPAPDPKSLTLRILDPACGSGSFLIVAYQHLLDWYLKKYTEDNPEKWAKGKNPRIRAVGTEIRGQGAGGGKRSEIKVVNWKLTISERKRILLDHIFGVDIDSQAVEVTKLSLLLKVLEGENEETMKGQLLLLHERALPDLGQNIKCGNSLIGSDFYKDMQDDLFDNEEMIRVNAFDWEKEFSDVFKVGVQASACSSGKGKDKLKLELQQNNNETRTQGFDAVIGNPPYVRQETLGEQFKTYAQSHYKTFAGTADLYTYFIEKGVSLLCDGGYFSYIVANKWMRANYGKPLRTWLKQQCIEEITDFGDLPVFENATTYPCIIRIKKAKPNPEFKVANIASLDFANLNEHVKEVSFPLKKTSLDDNGWALVNQENQNLLEKLRKAGTPLGEYVKGEIYRGVLTGLNEAFVIDCETRSRLIKEDAKSAEIIKPFLVGRDVKRYATPSSNRFLIFARRGIDIKNYPAIEKYLLQFRESLMPRPKDYKGNGWNGRKPGAYKWYEIQDAVDYYEKFEKTKIVYAEIALKGQFTLDTSRYYAETTCYIMDSNSRYLLGILNSKLFTYIFSKMSSEIRGGYFRWKKQYVEQIPIPPAPKPDTLTPLVSKMLDLHKKLSDANVPGTKTMLQRQIEATDNEIDRQVYALYGLTEEEIKIVEGS